MPIQLKRNTVMPNDLSKGNFQLNPNLKISAKEHALLLKYCLDRVDAATNLQSNATDRYESIDKELAGYIILGDADKRRQTDLEKGHGPKPYDINLQTVRGQLHDAIAYFMSVFFPPEGPYAATASNEKQSIAKGLSILMNQHSVQYKHYTTTARGLMDAMKYNIAMWGINWEVTKGTEVSNGTAGEYVENKNAVLAEGNRQEYLDPYNTYLDPSVHPTRVNELGEFFATVEVITEFRAKRLAAMGQFYNLARRNKSKGDMTYYTVKPDILGDAAKGRDGNGTDWVSWLMASEGGNVLAKDSIELVTINIWLPVDEFGIAFKQNSGAEGYQIWRLTIANASVILFAEPLVNAHGLLPIMVTMPWEDNFERQTQGFAEMMFPFQRFSSFQMNIHQQSQRKALNGLTFYNDRVMPEFKNADVSGKVPFSPNTENFDINKAILQVFDAPDTTNTLRDIETMRGFMEEVLPTQQAQQVAGLERATQYQAAATVQAGSKSNLMVAITIDEQALAVGRRMQLYNIMQFLQEVDVVDSDGNTVTVAAKDIREGKFEFLVGSGLRGLDKLVINETLNNILFAVLQSPIASQQIDTVALMNYITSTMGDYTNLNQFKFKNEFDRLTPEQKQQAFGLLQSALQAQGAEQNAAGQDGGQA